VSDRRTPVADALVEFVRGLELRSLPATVVEAASLCLTDWVGAAIRGSTEPLAVALDAVVGATGGEPQATIIGRGRRTSALLAALANGAQGHALDFDDTHLASIVHGSAPVAPVVLALAEWRRRPGPEAIEAFVAGFEIETRIGRVIGPTLADRGWHVTALLGHFGILNVSHDGSGNSKASYNDWKVGGSYAVADGPLKGFEIGAYYSGNNAKKAFYTDTTGYNTAKDTGVVYVKKTF